MSVIELDCARVMRWLELVDAAVENPPECVDILLILAEELDSVLLNNRKPAP